MSRRMRHFLLMLPFFIIGAAIPIYYFGVTGDGGVAREAMDVQSAPYSTDPSYSSPDDQQYNYPSYSDEPAPIVSASRNLFERAVDRFISPSLSPLGIKLLLLLGLFVGGFIIVRIVLAATLALSGAAKAAFSFVVHKGLAPMFMGFMAVGSTWGIHETVAQEFGLDWAAVTVAVTAAIGTLFALAGVSLRPSA